MRIGIIPVISYEKNTFYKVDVKLIDFLKYCFGKKIKIQFLYYKINTKIDLIISCGGNDLAIFKRLRSSLRFAISSSSNQLFSKLITFTVFAKEDIPFKYGII